MNKKVKPRIMTRDFCEVLLFFVIFPLQIVPIFILPPLLVFVVTLMTGVNSDTSFGLAFLTFSVLYFIWMTFSVWSLRLSEKGIEFVRLFGKPKLLLWNEITDIAEAPRKEILIKGWLWPMFPCREMTACLSALRHFRISWSKDCCYFPPVDADNFLKLVGEFKNKKPV